MNIVEQIHNEVDTAQYKLIELCQSVITKIEKNDELMTSFDKAQRLKKIGFKNSLEVTTADTFLQELTLNKEKLDELKKLMEKYPFHKFITEKQLLEICEKYNLIYSSVSNYMKDVPIKNLLEIENAKPLDKTDIISVGYKINEVDNNENFIKFMEMFNLDPNFITNEQVIDLHMKFYGTAPENWVFGGDDDMMVFHTAKKYHNLRFNIKLYSKIDKRGYFIAAPKSHFNLKDLENLKDKRGFLKIEEFEVKDPIVFQFCGEYLRIETKWGEEANDSILTQPNSN